jgi:hypothetical protein
MAAAIPWYKSPQTIGLITTFVAAAVALFPKVGTALGLTSPTAIATAVENGAGVVALIAPFVGVVVRSMQKTGQPITLTQAGADAHPATLAAEAAAANPSMVVPPDHPAQPIAVPPIASIPGKPWGK